MYISLRQLLYHGPLILYFSIIPPHRTNQAQRTRLVRFSDSQCVREHWVSSLLNEFHHLKILHFYFSFPDINISFSLSFSCEVTLSKLWLTFYFKMKEMTDIHMHHRMVGYSVHVMILLGQKQNTIYLSIFGIILSNKIITIYHTTVTRAPVN